MRRRQASSAEASRACLLAAPDYLIYGSSVAWCFTHLASAMKIVSSQMFVARSPTRSRFFEIEMSSMQ